MNADEPFPIVGIGASAGGLRALEEFFRTIPAHPGMAFVIVTHLAPDRHSYLTEILARQTALAVEVARDGQKVEPDCVYVLPPAASLTLAGGRLALKEIAPDQRERNPVDVFFASLAQDRGEYAVGIVLSGSGHDGVLGVKAIKEHGGLVLAQAGDGAGPGFADMPDSAIASGLVDFAVPVEDMAIKLLENARSFAALDALSEHQPPDGDDQAASHARDQIYAILRAQTGHDFSGYKARTFLRRVQRRMQVHQCDAWTDYVSLLQRQPDEATALFRDLLINVTSFFRDPDAFDALNTLVIPRLFEGRGAADAVRVWAPGCSTGEEVISIAILLREHMDRLRPPPKVTIFATDIDERALGVARAARYPEALLEGLSPARRQRFFHPQAGSFVVAREIRDLCVFSPHNLLRDPPLSRMDLISCRNLLIYFDADAQRQVLPIFHYALHTGGFLFLGKSESIGRFSELFSVVDKRNCVYQARAAGLAPRMPSSRMPSLFNGFRQPTFADHVVASPTAVGAASLRQTAEARIADRFGPPHVVVNEEGDIVHFSSRTGKYLEAPYGTPTRQLLVTARKELRLDLRGALRTAIETRRPVTREPVAFEKSDHTIERVSLTVEPLPDRPGGEGLFLVVFEDQPVPADAQRLEVVRAETGGAEQTELELRETRERLQATIEEYETSLEELKAANEELVSFNEEIQSSNEELESTKEELQSLNEELQTVNHELYAKINELDRANADMTNLFASTNVATIFLDRNLVIRSFTPAVAQLFNVIDTDKGRPLGDLAIKLDYPELQADIARVLASGAPIERPTHGNDAAAPYFLARLTPYCDASGAIDGVVATFVDVTGLAKSEERQRTLVSELNHRVKNMLMVVMAIAQQTLTRAPSSDEFKTGFFARLQALARSHDLLSKENWGEVEVGQALRQALEPYMQPGQERITFAGPPVAIPPPLALSLGTIIGELAMNAVKHGALSNEAGKVAIAWSKESGDGREAPVLALTWRETGGPPVTPPAKTGFGVKVIKREAEYSHSGTAQFDFAPGGVSVRLELRLPPSQKSNVASATGAGDANT
jgi:two-component system CheB/CheR fusion protein